MHFLYARNPWFYSMGHDIMIDFCIWTLQVDGLQVAPFDQHRDGDGSLRAVGLTASDWQSWLLQVIQQQGKHKEALRQNAQKLSTLPPPIPYAAWGGSEAVRERLIELWTLYGTVSNQRQGQEQLFSRALHKAEQTSGKRLYDELRPYHTRLPPLTIYLVAYERPLDYLIFPATLLMTRQEGQPDPKEFRERVLTAVAELAARPRQRGKQSPYTRVGEKSDKFSTLYRGYARQPIPSAPPRQETPQLDDPLRQIVLESLADERRPSYGIVDLATLQFLREKQRPGWRLYEVTFQEIDGESHRAIFILQQKEAGSWRIGSSGSSSDLSNQPFKSFAPVRDHPQIFLSVGWIGQQLLRHAHGHVIDNGFHVERVRLTNSAGQVLEDTVEDSYVFLAPESGAQIQLPMQAELYDHQGKLVWQQSVPDNGYGLPPWQKSPL